jgi:hypothetical protein
MLSIRAAVCRSQGKDTDSWEDHVKYALLIYSAPDPQRQPAAPDDGVLDSWLDYTQALKDAGLVLGAERLSGTDSATTVRLQAGERLLTDGPFVETKEHLLGFYLIDVTDLDAALDWAAKMPAMRHGCVEVRPVLEGEAWRAPLE